MTLSDVSLTDDALNNSLPGNTAIDDDLFFEVAPPDTRQRFLKFSLGNQYTFLPLENSTEIISVNISEVSPVPAMPKSILGVYNWRSELLWLIDLNHLTGSPPLLATSRYIGTAMAIVICCRNQWLGLVVEWVEDITLHEPEELQAIQPGIFSPQLESFLLGYFPSQGAVLDGAAIAQHPLWKQQHTPL